MKMKKLLFIPLIFISSLSFAQTPASTTQMQLVTSTTFVNRAIYNGMQVMGEVLVEAQSAGASAPIPAYTAACHTLRANYAKSFLLSPQAFASQSSNLLVSANYSGVVIVGSVTNRETDPTLPAKWDSTVADTAIMQAYRILMNTFAGCVINP
jgi:hypothetical protein